MRTANCWGAAQTTALWCCGAMHNTHVSLCIIDQQSNARTLSFALLLTQLCCCAALSPAAVSFAHSHSYTTPHSCTTPTDGRHHHTTRVCKRFRFDQFGRPVDETHADAGAIRIQHDRRWYAMRVPSGQGFGFGRPDGCMSFGREKTHVVRLGGCGCWVGLAAQQIGSKIGGTWLLGLQHSKWQQQHIE